MDVHTTGTFHDGVAQRRESNFAVVIHNGDGRCIPASQRGFSLLHGQQPHIECLRYLHLGVIQNPHGDRLAVDARSEHQTVIGGNEVIPGLSSREKRCITHHNRTARIPRAGHIQHDRTRIFCHIGSGHLKFNQTVVIEDGHDIVAVTRKAALLTTARRGDEDLKLLVRLHNLVVDHFNSRITNGFTRLEGDISRHRPVVLNGNRRARSRLHRDGHRHVRKSGPHYLQDEITVGFHQGCVRGAEPEEAVVVCQCHRR